MADNTTDIYTKIFWDMPVAAAEKTLLGVLEISASLVKEKVFEIPYETEDGQLPETKAQALSGIIHRLLGEFDSDLDTHELFLDALDALSEKTGKDYFWLMAAYGKSPKEYAAEHPELEKEKLDFLQWHNI